MGPAFNGLVLADSDVNADAIARFEKHLIAGGELLRENRSAEARKALSAALAIKPDDLKALALLGLACFRMGDFAGALPIYQSLVAVNRNDASYWLNLGLIHLKLNDARSAIEELQRSRELDPSQIRTVSYLGLAYARNGEYAQAYGAFLHAGEAELAREMEQYLSEDERARIQAGVSGAAADASTDRVSAPPAGRVSRASARSPRAPGSSDDDIEIVEEDSSLPVESKKAARPPAPPPPSSPGGSRKATQGNVPSRQKPSASGPIVMPGRGAEGAVSGESRGPGVISRAVAQAVPSTAATAGATRVAVGHKPPMSLSEFATSRIIRPEDGDHTFETSAGGVLIIRVKGRVYSRTEGVNVTGGELAYEVASRHVRGSSTGHDFSTDGRQLFIVSGNGHLIAAPLGEHFSAVTLDDDILYLREDLVFAFEEQLRWENGHVPGSQATIPMVQFRGCGEVAFRSSRPLLAIKLAPERMLYVDAQVLAGWIGRVVPRAVAPVAGGEQSTLFVECTGEGVVLVEEEEGGADEWSGAAVARAGEGASSPTAGSA